MKRAAIALALALASIAARADDVVAIAADGTQVTDIESPYCPDGWVAKRGGKVGCWKFGTTDNTMIVRIGEQQRTYSNTAFTLTLYGRSTVKGPH